MTGISQKDAAMTLRNSVRCATVGDEKAPAALQRPGAMVRTRGPDMYNRTDPTRAERYRAAARLLDHLADGDVAPEDEPAITDAVYRHLAAAGGR